MSVATLRSDLRPEPVRLGTPSDGRTVPASGRADGAAEVAFARHGEVTRLAHLYQRDPCRVLFPRPARAEPAAAVLVTTSGGVVGGDRLRFAIAAGAGARCSVTTQAAEKIYRSAGTDSRITITVDAGPGATLEWMPQETILFDGARLRRSTAIALAGDARLIAGEIAVFGRRARGERFGRGLFCESWRVRRDGRLVWADGLRLDGDVAGTLDRPAAFAGAAALASMIYAGGDAAARLAAARGWLDRLPGDLRAGASCLGEVLLIRVLGRDPQEVRSGFGEVWAALRAEALGFPAAPPRIWNG